MHLCIDSSHEFTNVDSASEIVSDDCGSFFEGLPIGVYVIQDKRICYISSCLSNMLGYEKPENLIGKPFWEIIHPDDRVRIESIMQLGRGSRAPDRVACRALRKDDSSIQVIIEWGTFTHNECDTYVGHITNSTSLKMIQDSFEKYITIINEIEESVVELNLKGTVTFSNRAGCEIWGTSLNETIGKNYRSFVDQKSAETLYQIYNEIFRTGIPNRNIIHEIIRESGPLTVENSVSLIRDRDGSPTGFRVVSRDINKRIETEKALAEYRTSIEAIFSSSEDAIITVDSKMRVIAANASTQSICGLKGQEIQGKVFGHCLYLCSGSCGEILRQAIEKKTPIKGYYIECNSSLHHQRVVNVRSTPLLDSENKFMGAVLIIRDVTLIRNLERELSQGYKFQGIIGKSKQMRHIFDLLKDLADLDTTVLVTGESGTGKELIAKALHSSSHRADKKFVNVNCSALVETLLESELFGHVKGAFTGAVKDKQGRFQVADGGTIMLDEIGDISPLMQLKLLRVLEEKEFERVGENITQKVDVRIIACTNKDLKKKVRDGEFRGDLYYRLNVIEIHMPPLREKLDDLPLLVEQAIDSFNRRYKKKIKDVSRDVLDRFMKYPWPGNVRELEHAIECAFVLCHGTIITIDHLPREIRNYKEEAHGTAPFIQMRKEENARNLLDALNKTFWNKTEAARLLGISRQTLYRKINEYKFSIGP